MDVSHPEKRLHLLTDALDRGPLHHQEVVDVDADGDSPVRVELLLRVVVHALEPEVLSLTDDVPTGERLARGVAAVEVAPPASRDAPVHRVVQLDVARGD